MKAIGIYVRELRDAAGFTQEELAQLAGTSEKSLRNLEGGDRNPKIDKLAKIVELVKGSTAHIARLMPDSAPESLAYDLAQEIINKTGFTDAQREYLESLSADQKAALLAVAHQMQPPP